MEQHESYHKRVLLLMENRDIEVLAAEKSH